MNLLLDNSGVDSSVDDEWGEYSGAFNTLMINLFSPATGHYQVIPRTKRLHGFPGFSLFYVIKLQTKKGLIPVFFLSIKRSIAIHDSSLREEADEQMRDMFADLTSDSPPISQLYGVSALGTRFSIYEYTTSTGEVVPPRIVSQSGELAEAVGPERWNYDIMESQGEAKFEEIVAKVKEIAANSR